MNRTTGSNWPIYRPLLPILAGGALIFSTLADYTTPLIQRKVLAGLSPLMSQRLVGLTDWPIGSLAARRFAQVTNLIIETIKSAWQPGYPEIGNWVRYCGEDEWTILTVERLLACQHLWFCPADAYGFWYGNVSSRSQFGAELEVSAWQIALPLTRLSRRRNRLDWLKWLKQRFFHS